MKTLYVSQQGCYVALKQESLVIRQGKDILARVQLPLLEQVLIFGKAQVTTQAIHVCLARQIPILYLSRMGYCYGRILAIEQGYRPLFRYQQQLGLPERLMVARLIVFAKLKNSRVILQRQQRRLGLDALNTVLRDLDYFAKMAAQASILSKLNGYEGAAANAYFSAFSLCLSSPEFTFVARSRRPPGNPVNALLSFGYQVLWNHLLTLIEFQGLDPYQGCLHEGSERHAALASDLIEEFRAPIIDSLVLYMINNSMVKADRDFEFHNGGCFLNESGRRSFLAAFVQRMEEIITLEEGGHYPRWHLLLRQVKRYKQFIYAPSRGYEPYRIR